MKQMPAESTMFREVDRTWRKLMNQCIENPAALHVIKIEGLKEMLVTSKKQLDEVSKGLNEYLESKQSLFPRFYFLSNDELLEILSETKEPLRVQPHLKKCFEGIAKLHFDDEKKIHAMYSSEGEKVPFIKVVDPVAAKGQVEQWLV
jgi:dynein heavy chain